MVASQTKPGTSSSGRKDDDSLRPLSYPQAVPIPDIMFLYTGAHLGLQYLKLYRTAWWLPHSYTNQALNFHLIDPFTIAFSLTLLSEMTMINRIIRNALNQEAASQTCIKRQLEEINQANNKNRYT